MKQALFLNIAKFENQIVGEFLDYLENVEHISLSSHTASIRSLNPPKDVPQFTIIPMMTPLCQAIELIADGQYRLFVGAKLTPLQALMRRFFKGLVVDNHTGLFKMGAYSPVIFDLTYQPVEEHPTPSIVIDKHIIETVRTTESESFSQNRPSAKISSFIISGKTEYSKKKSFTSEGSIITSNAVVSLLNKKMGLFMDESKIDLDPSFIKDLYCIVDIKSLSSFDRTELVVKVLNHYGWYVSNHFTLGGRLDVVKSLNESSASNKTDELQALELKLNAAYGAFNGSVGASSKKSSSSVNMASFFSSNERVTSTIDPAMDIASFMENVKIEENCRIIALDNIVPTCKFLLRKHSHLFGEIYQLIIHNAHRQSIRNLQPYIDMVQYVHKIWDVTPF